jgi:hypothetical protein
MGTMAKPLWISWIVKKVADFFVDMFAGLLGGAAFWLSIGCVFYFDNWSERVLGIFLIVGLIYIILKCLEKILPRQ